MNYKYKLQILDSMVYTKSSLTFLFQKKKKKKKKKKHKERKKNEKKENEKNKKGKTKNAFARLFTFKLSKKIIKK